MQREELKTYFDKRVPIRKIVKNEVMSVCGISLLIH